MVQDPRELVEFAVGVRVAEAKRTPSSNMVENTSEFAELAVGVRLAEAKRTTPPAAVPGSRPDTPAKLAGPLFLTPTRNLTARSC